MELNRLIDHTLLSPAAMDVAFETLLEEAVEHNFHSVCVAPYIAAAVVSAMSPYPEVRVCTVVGFPHGNVPLEFKLREATHFVQAGVHEIDWVMHYGDALNEKWSHIALEMGQMASLCRSAGVTSKCIVETAYFPSKGARKQLFELVRDTGVDFIKTSTGFAGEGAKVEHVQYWNELRGESEGPLIKAAGGIKTLEQAEAFIEAGANRLGCSSSVGIMMEYNNRKA